MNTQGTPERAAGKFIVLEGVEGSGKSTQVRLLVEWLQAQGISCIATREPGGTAIGEDIRQILLHQHDMPPVTELLLFNAARAVFVKDVVRPALEAGTVVVADRFWLSSMAYQGYGRGLPIDQVRAICELAADGATPDITIVLELPVEVGEARREQRGGPDRIERAGSEFHRKVAEAYRLLTGTMPGVERVSGRGTAEEVHGRIRQLLGRRFPETFA